MTLREVPVRTTVSVVKIHGEGAFRRYELSLRKADADSIDVTVKEGV